MGYQFLHIGNYSRAGSNQGGKTKFSAGQILAEQGREDGACDHVKDPQKPELLFGVEPGEVLGMANAWADQAKDSIGRNLRKDGNVLVAGVISLPSDEKSKFDAFAKDSIDWLQDKYGDRLKSVVAHHDEAHPHLHFSVVPNHGERFEEIHEGRKAVVQAKEQGLLKGDQNKAYKEAMKGLQSDFYEKVGAKHGLTKTGPARERLTREEWKERQEQARAIADRTKKLETKEATYDQRKAQAMAHLDKRKEGLDKMEKAVKERENSLGRGVLGSIGSAFNSKNEANARALNEAYEQKVADLHQEYGEKHAKLEEKYGEKNAKLDKAFKEKFKMAEIREIDLKIARDDSARTKKENVALKAKIQTLENKLEPKGGMSFSQARGQASQTLETKGGNKVEQIKKSMDQAQTDYVIKVLEITQKGDGGALAKAMVDYEKQREAMAAQLHQAVKDRPELER